MATQSAPLRGGPDGGIPLFVGRPYYKSLMCLRHPKERELLVGMDVCYKRMKRAPR